jgi:hypothetical protein
MGARFVNAKVKKYAEQKDSMEIFEGAVRI